jgi:hypothetical protein
MYGINHCHLRIFLFRNICSDNNDFFFANWFYLSQVFYSKRDAIEQVESSLDGATEEKVKKKKKKKTTLVSPHSSSSRATQPLERSVLAVASPRRRYRCAAPHVPAFPLWLPPRIPAPAAAPPSPCRPPLRHPRAGRRFPRSPRRPPLPQVPAPAAASPCPSRCLASH